MPDKSLVMETFRRLSEIAGKKNMAWRYDPILVDGQWTVSRHIEAFTEMCKKLSGYTETCVISFIDLYEKVKMNYPEARRVPWNTQLQLTEAFVNIAAGCGMRIKPCGEDPRLAAAGADCSGCMTRQVFESAIGRNLILPSNPNNRKECACYITGDIGVYNTCGHLCRYCYANADQAAVRQAMRHHDPASPMLIGNLLPGDTVHEAKQVSWIDPQMRLNFNQ